MIPAPIPSKFRFDINGMRAIAVVAVVMFHFKIPGFDGGFIGVDVFFVLSGFLMTSILVKGLEKRGAADYPERITAFLWRFYLARARRIIPALLVLVLVLMFLGWWALPQEDYRLLGKRALSALTFLSNALFWREAGYFDSASHDKWLLHTWSLSVEWQFYLILPLALLLIWRLQPNRMAILVTVALGAAVSLAISIWLINRSPSAAFFMLPSRAWEMLGGGLTFLLTEKVQLRQLFARWLEALGLLCIGLSITVFDVNSLWPGLNALMPVTGSILVLVGARQSGWVKNPIVHWLGQISYSLYLWHWPIFVALVYLEVESNVSAIIASLLISLSLGTLSYHFIENKSRLRLSRCSETKTSTIIAITTLVAAIPALTVFQLNGVDGRMPPAVEVAYNEAFNINPRREECHHLQGKNFSWCIFGGPDIEAIVIGDSHAASVISAVVEGLRNKNDSAGVLYNSYTSCPTLFGVKQNIPNRYCAEFNEHIAEHLQNISSSLPLIIVNSGAYSWTPNGKDDITPLVYFHQPYTQTSGAFLEEFSHALVDSTCRLANRRQVYLVQPIPRMKQHVPKTVARRILLGHRDTDVRTSLDSYYLAFDAILKAQDTASALCDVAILNTSNYLCGERYCYGSINGRPLYYDDNHLSEYGNQILIPMFQNEVHLRQ